MRTAAMVLVLGSLLLSPPLGAAPVRLVIAGARLDAAKIPPAGKPRSTAPLSDLACLSLPGLRAMVGACGGADLGHMASRPALDPLVRIELGDRVIRTYPVPGTLEPRWDYRVLLHPAQVQRQLSGKKEAKVLLYDYEGPGAERLLGSATVRAQDLLSPGERRLRLGPAELSYRVEPMPPDPAPRTYRFHVPATEQMADLARRAKTEGEGYVLVPVSEGEVIEVRASGTVRPNARKHPERVAGPAGIPTIIEKIQYNQPGFRGCPGCNHGALIGQLGTGAMVLGADKRFVAESAGYLILGVNDLKVSDNQGGFDVVVTVSPPREAQMAPMGKARGGEQDAPPAAMDARVVQQTVDAHGAEIDACNANEPNPYGDVVLSFTISADGSPLGVIVEKASPNLRRAGECMRQKALRWRFPPPRGVVTARYPISFSPG